MPDPPHEAEQPAHFQRARDGLSALAERLQDPLLLLLRLYFGLMFLVIGIGKLSDLGGTRGYFESLRLPLPMVSALAAGLVETLGGLLLALGAAARLVALPLIGTMLVAYFAAHSSEKFLQAKPFLFLFASLLIFVFGPGRYSLDARLAGRKAPATDPA